MSVVPDEVLLGTVKEAAAYITQIRTLRAASPSLAKEIDAELVKQAYNWTDYTDAMSSGDPLTYSLTGAGIGGLLSTIDQLKREKEDRNWWDVLTGAGLGGATGAGLSYVVPQIEPLIDRAWDGAVGDGTGSGEGGPSKDNQKIVSTPGAAELFLTDTLDAADELVLDAVPDYLKDNMPATTLGLAGSGGLWGARNVVTQADKLNARRQHNRAVNKQVAAHKKNITAKVENQMAQELNRVPVQDRRGQSPLDELLDEPIPLTDSKFHPSEKKVLDTLTRDQKVQLLRGELDQVTIPSGETLTSERVITVTDNALNDIKLPPGTTTSIAGPSTLAGSPSFHLEHSIDDIVADAKANNKIPAAVGQDPVGKFKYDPNKPKTMGLLGRGANNRLMRWGTAAPGIAGLGWDLKDIFWSALGRENR